MAAAAVFALCGFAFGIFNRAEDDSSQPTDSAPDTVTNPSEPDPERWELVLESPTDGYVPNLGSWCYSVLPGETYRVMAYPSDETGNFNFVLSLVFNHEIAISVEETSLTLDIIGVTLPQPVNGPGTEFIDFTFTVAPKYDSGYGSYINWTLEDIDQSETFYASSLKSEFSAIAIYKLIES